MIGSFHWIKQRLEPAPPQYNPFSTSYSDLEYRMTYEDH